MELTIKEIAEKYNTNTGVVYYYVNKLGLSNKYNPSKFPRVYNEKVINKVGKAIKEHQRKKLSDKDATYWKNRAMRVEKNNSILKRKIKAYSNIKSQLEELENIKSLEE